MSKQTFTNLQEKGKYLWDLIRKNKKNIIHSNLSVSNKFLAIIEILNNELFEKMQAKQGFENSSMITTALRIAKTDGIKGFYRF